jgi:hypothetical protein
MAQDGLAWFRPLSAEVSAPGGAPAHLPATAQASAPGGVPAFLPATATGVATGATAASGDADFRRATATGAASAGSVASGDAEFEAAAAEGNSPVAGDATFEAMSAVATGLTGTVAIGDAHFRPMAPDGASVGGSLALGAPVFALGTATGAAGSPTFAEGVAAFRRLAAASSGLVGSVASGDGVFVSMLGEGEGNQPSVAVGAAAFEYMVPSGQASPAATTDYRTWAINVSNDALTEYQNFDFDSYAELGGRFYGAGPDGLFELAGTTDDGASIAWAFRTGMMDGSNPGRTQVGGMRPGEAAQLKRMGEIVLAARFDGPLRARVWTDDSTYFDYSVENHRADVVHQVRAKLGKGLRSRFYRVQLSGLNNAKAEVSRMELPMTPLKRRLG